MRTLNASEELFCTRWSGRCGYQELYHDDGRLLAQVLEELLRLDLGFRLADVRWPVVEEHLNAPALTTVA